MKLMGKMDKHVKNGLISMMCWILFLVVTFGTYSYVQDAPLKGLLDKETGGFISLAFFVLWALIWFAIGQHYSRDYEQKKEAYRKQYPSVSESQLAKAFRDEYSSGIAKMLSGVFFISVLAYVAANVREEVTTRNCIHIGVLMALSIITYWYYKAHQLTKRE